MFPNVRVENSAVPVDGKSVSAPGTAGMRAYRDEQTGKLRNASPEELVIEALQTPPSNDAADATVFITANGKRAALGDSFMSNAVVQRDSEGRLRMYCMPGDAKDAAFLDKVLSTGKEVRLTTNLIALCPSRTRSSFVSRPLPRRSTLPPPSPLSTATRPA